MSRFSLVPVACVLACSGPAVPLGEDKGGTDAADTEGPDASSGADSMSSPQTGADPTGTPTASAEGGSDSDSDGGDQSASDTMPATSTGDSDGETAGEETTGEPPPEGSAVIFIDFSGPTLTEGAVDDATADVTQIAGMGGDLSAFGNGAMDDQIVAAVQEDFSGIAVFATSTRPVDGDYARVVVTPTNPFPGAFGIAVVDCGNANPNNIAFVFASQSDGLSADQLAGQISRQAAATFGLERVSGPGDLLDGTTSLGVASFTDECHPLQGTAMCQAEHAAHCGGAEQNSFAELEALFGS